MKLFDGVSPLDARYYGTDKGFYEKTHPYLSEKAQISYQIRVEIALLQAFADMGLVPAEEVEQALPALRAIPPEEVYQEEEITQHNVRALVHCMQRRLEPKLASFVHLTATSCDITDTARSLCLKEYVLDVLVPLAADLENDLIRLARDHAGTPQMGRTHGQHAIPTTFGNAVALYVSRLGGRVEALHRAAQSLRGKMAGAVGVYSAQALVFPHDPAELERRVMQKLGLEASPTNMASQIVEPEFVTDVGYAAISLFSVLANLADDMRHLMRTEIRELGKRTDPGHVGSSTMPHKVNPKNFENVKSLWKAYMPRIVTLLSDQISEHQRDLTNSASGRFAQELLAATAYALHRTRKAMAKITVEKQAMLRHLEASRQTFVAEPLYIVLAAHGNPNGYEIMKAAAEKARSSGSTVAQLLDSDPELQSAIASLPDEAEKTLRKVLTHPETYLGLAEEAARRTCDHWEQRIRKLVK